jgi:predicted membrane protein
MPDNLDNERWDNERWDDSPGAEDRRWEQFRDVRAGRRLYRRSQWHRTPASRLFIAILLIGAGTLLFLSNLGLLPAFNVWDFWPLIFVIAGIGKFVGERCATGKAIGVVMTAGGTLFLLVTLGVLHVRAHDDSWPISLVLLAAGAIAFIKVLESNERGRPQVGFPQEAPAPSAVSPDEVNEHVVLGAVKRKIQSANFRGGKLECILGSIDLNFRRAEISSVERSATIAVKVVFGSVELRVPETWRVVTQAADVFGSIEDKTIANKSPGFDGPTLVIVGSVAFGSIEIKD